MKPAQPQKTLQNPFASTEFKRFLTLVHLLFSDTTKLSFRSKSLRKDSLIKLVSSLLSFLALSALCYGLYFIASVLHIFSLLSFIPETVPSFLTSILLILGLVNILVGLTKTLYFSEDNRLMITYPCRGITVFMARLSVFFLCEYLRSLMFLGPVLFGYLLFSHATFPLYLWLFVALFLLTLAEVLVGAILTIPGFYVARFLRRNSRVAFISYFLLFAVFVGLVTWVMNLIPNKIDIFSNWGPYFAQIQLFLKDYRDNAWFLYDLTLMAIGYTNGFNPPALNWTSLFTGLSVAGVILVFGLLTYFIVSPLYLRLASASFEYTSDNTFQNQKMRRHRFAFAQATKEGLLLAKNPDLFMSLFSVFVFMPIFITLLDKIFGAMNTTVNGNVYISVVNVLLMLLIILNSNGTISHIYSAEGKAFFLNKTYPQKPMRILLSKLVLPWLLGSLSIIVSCLLYGQVTGQKLTNTNQSWVNPQMEVCLIFALLSFYTGHMLFAAGLDFSSIRSRFSAETIESANERRLIVSAFALALIVAVLFYFFMRDDILLSYVKLLILGLLFLAFNVLLFVRKAQFLYGEGE